jgi:hypothetical protein
MSTHVAEYFRQRRRAHDISARSAVFRNAEVVQQLSRRNEIDSTETLGEAIVNRLQAGGGVGGTALIVQQAGEARRRPQLP